MPCLLWYPQNKNSVCSHTNLFEPIVNCIIMSKVTYLQKLGILPCKMKENNAYVTRVLGDHLKIGTIMESSLLCRDNLVVTFHFFPFPYNPLVFLLPVFFLHPNLPLSLSLSLSLHLNYIHNCISYNKLNDVMSCSKIFYGGYFHKISTFQNNTLYEPNCKSDCTVSHLLRLYQSLHICSKILYFLS